MLNGEKVVLELVQHEILETPVKTYNFEVADYHTYYVGTNNVLVHNDCAVNTLTDISKRFTPDQQAVIDLGREAYKNGGTSLVKQTFFGNGHKNMAFLFRKQNITNQCSTAIKMAK